jgi:hypothetical protein
VTFVLGPLILLIAGYVSIKAKSWFNYDLSPAEAAAYITSIVGGIALLIWKWLHNRGKYEIAKLSDEPVERVERLERLIEDRLPPAPQAPKAPEAGAPSKPRAPGQPKS